MFVPFAPQLRPRRLHSTTLSIHLAPSTLYLVNIAFFNTQKLFKFGRQILLGQALLNQDPQLDSTFILNISFTPPPRYPTSNTNIDTTQNKHPADNMAASDLSVLLDMGFMQDRAELAVKKTGGRTLST